MHVIGDRLTILTKPFVTPGLVARGRFEIFKCSIYTRHTDLTSLVANPLLKAAKRITTNISHEKLSKNILR